MAILAEAVDDRGSQVVRRWDNFVWHGGSSGRVSFSCRGYRPFDGAERDGENHGGSEGGHHRYPDIVDQTT